MPINNISAKSNLKINNIKSTPSQSGESDYEKLYNLPSINNILLLGNKNSKDLGLQPAGNYIQDDNYMHTDNNFTDTYKNNVDDNTDARHTHSNIDALNRINLDDIDNWNNKQDTLISGQNIKNINNKSLLGFGNIDINENIFDNDIILAGNWTQVGNLTKNQTGTAVYEAEGKTAVEVITDILSQDANPTITQPSISINLSNSGNVEVGNTISVNATTTFNSGSYTYDNTTGVEATSYSFSDTKSNTDTNTTGSTTFNSYSLLVEDNTNYTASVTVSYSAGNIPHTQLGNEYPAGQIQAGTKSKTSSAIKGVRYMFNGANTEIKTLNSSNIRALSGSIPSNNFSITIPNNCMQVIISMPKSLNKTLSKVEDVGAFGTDIKARFEKSTVSVEGANSYTAIDYDVWEYIPATKLDSNTFRVTMN